MEDKRETGASASVTQGLVNNLAQMWAKDIELRLNTPLTLIKTPKAKPLTTRQRIRLWPRKTYQAAGEYVTRKLMKHFDIYECDGWC